MARIEKPVSLYPLKPEEAMADLLKVKPSPKEPRAQPPKKEKSRPRTKRDGT